MWNFGEGLVSGLLAIGVLIAILTMVGIMGILGVFSSEIRSEKKLEPVRYELTIKNNQVDTIWIYQKP